MKRLILTVIVVLSFVCVNMAMAEDICYDATFAVSEPPIETTLKIDPCRRIITPPDTVMSIEELDRAWSHMDATLKLSAGAMLTEGMLFRTGAQPVKYDVKPMKGKSWAAFKDREIRVKIVDVPQHLKGGESALWYEISKTTQEMPVVFLKDYATQVLVPTGYDIRITADVGMKVKYAGKETAYEPEQQVFVPGKPGLDLVTIYGIDRDGKASVTVSRRKDMIRKISLSGKRKNMYDFSKEAIPFEVNIPFGKEGWTHVILPPPGTFTSDATVDVEIVYVDGYRVIGGPSRKNSIPSHVRWNDFKIKGLKKNGSYKLTFE